MKRAVVRTEWTGQFLLALLWQGAALVEDRWRQTARWGGWSRGSAVVMVVVLMDSSRVSMLHPPLTRGGLRLPLCVAMIRHPFAACGTGRVEKARFIGRFDQHQPHHVTEELQRAPPSCDSQCVYMNELTKMQNNKRKVVRSTLCPWCLSTVHVILLVF